MKLISLPCPVCQEPLRIPARFTGRRGRCAACAAVFVVNENPMSEALAALDHFFEGHLFPQGLPGTYRLDGHLPPPDDVGFALREMRRTADRARVLAPAYRDVRDAYRRVFEELRDVHGGAAILDAGLSIQPGDFGIPRASFDDARAAGQEKEQRLCELREQASAFEELTILRIHATLALLGTPAIAAQLRDARELQADAMRMRHAIQVIGELEDELEAASLMRFRLRVLESAQRGGAHTPRLTPRIDRERVCLHGVLKQAQRALHAAPEPFTPGARPSSISDVVLPTVPDVWDSAAIQLSFDTLEKRLRDVWVHAWGRLARVCMQVENASGSPELFVEPSAVSRVVLGRLAR